MIKFLFKASLLQEAPKLCGSCDSELTEEEYEGLACPECGEPPKEPSKPGTEPLPEEDEVAEDEDLDDTDLENFETSAGYFPRRTVKAYKLFRVDKRHPGKLFPLFVNANKPIPMGVWVDAEAGELTPGGKVRSRLGDLAYRPGFHGGDIPLATHIGDFSEEQLREQARINAIRNQAKVDRGISNTDRRGKRAINKEFPYPSWATTPSLRSSSQVWAEVDMPDDVDWHSEAQSRMQYTKKNEPKPGTAEIKDTIPFGGHYRYKTSPRMTGDWMISGNMRINRVLTDEQVSRINNAEGTRDLTRKEPLDLAQFGFGPNGKPL